MTIVELTVYLILPVGIVGILVLEHWFARCEAGDIILEDEPNDEDEQGSNPS